MRDLFFGCLTGNSFQVSQKSGIYDNEESNERVQCATNSAVPQAIIRPVPHATSLDTITKRQRTAERENTPVQPTRSATMSKWMEPINRGNPVLYPPLYGRFIISFADN